MPRKALLNLTICTLAAIAIAPSGRAQDNLPDLSGTYRCEPYPASCANAGQTYMVTQSGKTVMVKNDKGDIGQGTLTSNKTVSLGAPWNTIGIISADARTVEWSAGTRWRKQ